MEVIAESPGKINLGLWVGAPDHSGYHPLLTAFQAVDLWDSVTASHAESMSVQIDGSVDCGLVPTDERNLAWQAARAVAEQCGTDQRVALRISKHIPVAGGMAGGSADAAAALRAVDALWECGLSEDDFFRLASGLGSDVPFSLHGQAAIGKKRGDELTPVPIAAPLHFVLCPADGSLSTAAVYAEYDRLQPEAPVPEVLDQRFLDAWIAGDASTLAPLIHNDLEQAAFSLMPGLETLAAEIQRAGALRAAVSGSGPTLWGLASSAQHALDIAHALRAQGITTWVTQSSLEKPRLRLSR
jgi:4-diphosphocytidyl-2-C-methyl-D-erythritol kinase